jgi:hypothetical protein
MDFEEIPVESSNTTETCIAPATSNVGTPPQAPAKDIPACTPSSSTAGTSQQQPRPKSNPSPLKRGPLPQKRRSRCSANVPSIPPLFPSLSRPLKAKSRRPPFPHHLSRSNLVPLMSVRTGIFMRRSRLLEILGGPSP